MCWLRQHVPSLDLNERQCAKRPLRPNDMEMLIICLGLSVCTVGRLVPHK